MNQDQYKCHSYYGDDNILRDCTCGKCEVKIPMRILEIFEGENSGLTNAFREAVAREQSHTEKRLEFESFDSFFAGLPMQEEKNAIKLYEKYIQSFLSTKIAQAIAEEKARVRGVIKDMRISAGEKRDPWSIQIAHIKDQESYNKALDDLLSSLEKLTDNK